MNDLTAELVAAVASAAVTATLTASGTRATPKTPTPGHKPLSTPKPIKPPRRAVDRQALAVAVHEAGHAVAGVILGAELRNAVVGSSRVTGLEGLTTFTDRPHGSDALIHYGGPYGQAKFQAGGRRPTQRQLFAVFDGHGCRDQRALVAGGGLHEGADVQPIIDRAWPAVLTVARQLHLTGEIFQADVLAALGVDTTGNVGAQLSSIRSGGQIVPPFITKQPAPA